MELINGNNNYYINDANFAIFPSQVELGLLEKDVIARVKDMTTNEKRFENNLRDDI